MSGRVTLRLPARGGGRRRGRGVGPAVASGGPGAPQSPPPERIPRVARVLALAHRWRKLIESGAVRDQADLARLVGVSRARVTQVMSLLWLAPDIQEAVLDALPGVPGSERALRGVASHMLWAVQREILALADSASGSVITVVTDESTPPHLTGHMPQRGP